MLKFLSIFFSTVFHPFLFPSYGLLILMYAFPYNFAQLELKGYVMAVFVMFMTTFAFPGISILMMKALGIVDDLELRRRKQRIIPFIATGTFYLWALMMFKPGAESLFITDPFIARMLMGGAFSLFFAFFINLVMLKVSLHSLAVSSLVGVLIFTNPYAFRDMSWFLIGAVLVCGAVGASRLYLGVHRPREVYTGYLVGVMGQYFGFGAIGNWLLS